VSTEVPFDRWVKGDEHAISVSAKRSFALFNSKAQCSKCHSGWEFTDHGFHDIGTPDEDPGRGRLLKLESMQHAFKTPGLRNVTQSAAFMHDGSERTLEGVIDFYDKGGLCVRASLAPEITPLHLSAGDKRSLLDFLATLTSEEPRAAIPVLPGKRFQK
jgi:cytochrome c peroxidase